ncbi:hypothetical protein H0H92_004022 [Tricholoma furcatifolium]|nr:hypothetical protein H0H92_004022 [Tricholoma furcatifolium]
MAIDYLKRKANVTNPAAPSDANAIIKCLSADILAKIFLSVPQDYVYDRWEIHPPHKAVLPRITLCESSSLDPMVLAQVSRRWREVALSTPQLWSSIYIFCSDKQQRVPLLKAWLERSSTCPLTIRFIESTCDFEDYSHIPESRFTSEIMALLILEAHRWKAIDFSFARRISPILSNISSTSLPVIETASIVSREHPGDLFEGVVPSDNIWRVIHSSPSFRSGRWEMEYLENKMTEHSVVALSGEQARKVFFNEQTLNLPEGYRVLMGGAPRLSDIDVKEPEELNASVFARQLLGLLKRERIEEALPILFDDVQKRMKGWGKEGTLNPFKEVYDLVFQMTVRLATCRELSEDKESISQLAGHYWELEKSATPVSVLFPWFPGPAKKAKEAATRDLYNLLHRYIEIRRDAKESTSDALDVLIAAGESDDAIIAFVFGVIFAGVINTGMNVCWNLLYIGLNPELKTKAVLEVQSLIANHTDPVFSDQPLHKRLASIPMSAWESEMPLLDSVIRETLRMVLTGAVLRRNLGKDVEIDGSKISRGEFLAYPLADVHHNPEIYPQPLKFDPGRYDEGRAEDKKVAFGYVGWGAGRHPCLGMRVAKLEMKLVLALIFAGYDFEIVDADGDIPTTLPRPDKNDFMQARPIGEPCFLKFRRVVD